MPVTRALAAALTVLSILLLAPAAHAARGFSLGVQAGDVTARSAILWAHANQSGRYVLDIATNRRFTRDLELRLVRARRSNDNTIQIRVRGLDPNERYFYRFSRARLRSDVGTFVTAPRPSQNATIEFAWTGDTDFNTAPGGRRPYWNNGSIFRRMRAERNDFNVHLGDTMYSDSEIPGRLQPIALTVRQKWAKYRTNLANRHLRGARGAAGFYSHWDDHEFVNDFSPAENSFDNGVNIAGSTLYRRGAQAFRDYSPVRWTSRDGLYRRFRWGRNLELFFLDERSFRSANADAGGVCDNRQTGNPDFAPTAPQSTRAAFAPFYPPLAEPVPQACLDAIRDPNRTYLGQRQLTRFIRDVDRSTARFKVVMNELAIQQYYINPYDRWEGFEAERQRVLTALQDVENVIFLSTDVHAVLANDARFQTLEPGGPRNSGIMDITVGSAATANFGLEIDNSTGRPGTGALTDAGFLTPQPPGGVGMQCAVVDRFSYGQVRVTRNRLTVTPRGIDGRPVTDDGRPCGPFVLNYAP
jgi:phosphodiesterase/alkaline phosphatase D-like protein